MSLVSRESAGWLTSNAILHPTQNNIFKTPIHTAFVVSEWLDRQSSLSSLTSSLSFSLKEDDRDYYCEEGALFSIRGGTSVAVGGDYTLVAFEDLWDGPLPSFTAPEAPKLRAEAEDDAPRFSARNDNPRNNDEDEDDVDLLTKAEEHARQQRILEAARLLSRIQDPRCLQDHHVVILEQARLVEGLIQDHAQRTLLDVNSSVKNNDKTTSTKKVGSNGGWIRHGTVHGDRHSVMYYKVGSNGEMTVRMETPVEASLLVPLLSVFHEFQLWQTWVPRFTKPFSLGLRCSRVLKALGRGCQIVQGIVDLPWPLNNRDTVLEVLTVDDIEGHHGAIYVKVFSHHHDTRVVHVDGVPPCEPGADRMEFDGGISFQPCPPTHPSLGDHQQRPPGLPDARGSQNEEPLLLMTFTAYMRPTVNLIVKTFFPPTWEQLLRVAEGIRDGKLPLYGAAMGAQEELYDWVQSRMNVLIRQSRSGG